MDPRPKIGRNLIFDEFVQVGQETAMVRYAMMYDAHHITSTLVVKAIEIRDHYATLRQLYSDVISMVTCLL